MRVTYTNAEKIARDIWTLWFYPEKPVPYIAGQFTELHLPHSSADERGERRWFTLSSSPTEKLVSITTRMNNNDGSSYKRALQTLQFGQELSLADPMGDFVLPKSPDIPLIFVAGGMGITPVRSMVKYLHDRGETRDVQLLYAMRYDDEAAFLPLFQSYPLAFSQLVSMPSKHYRGKSGAITTEMLLELAAAKPDAYLYLSGPEPMVEKFYKELTAAGVPSERLVTDYFPGYAPI